MRRFNNYGIEIKSLPIKTLPAIKPKVKKERIKHYTKEQILHYNRLNSRGVIENTIEDEMDDSEIVFGAMAVNLNLQHQPFLQKMTSDVDCLSENPKKSAQDTVRSLNKRFSGKYFRMEKGVHPGTWKVVSNSGIGAGRPIIDYSSMDPYREDTPERKIPDRERKMLKKIEYHKTQPGGEYVPGIKYVTKNWLIRQAKGVLRDDEQSWRHKKERSKINRLKVSRPVKRKTYVRIPPKQKTINGERFKLEGFCNSKHAIEMKVTKFKKNGYRTRTYYNGRKFYLYSKKR